MRWLPNTHMCQPRQGAGSDHGLAAGKVYESGAEPAGIPSDLARRRPDIHAATADIGVAVAEFYRLS